VRHDGCGGNNDASVFVWDCGGLVTEAERAGEKLQSLWRGLRFQLYIVSTAPRQGRPVEACQKNRCGERSRCRLKRHDDEQEEAQVGHVVRGRRSTSSPPPRRLRASGASASPAFRQSLRRWPRRLQGDRQAYPRTAAPPRPSRPRIASDLCRVALGSKVGPREGCQKEMTAMAI
jgi:hypothetical protein